MNPFVGLQMYKVKRVESLPPSFLTTILSYPIIYILRSYHVRRIIRYVLTIDISNTDYREGNGFSNDPDQW